MCKTIHLDRKEITNHSNLMEIKKIYLIAETASIYLVDQLI